MTDGSILFLWQRVIPLICEHQISSILNGQRAQTPRYSYSFRAEQQVSDFIGLLMSRRRPRVEAAAWLISHLKRLPSTSGFCSRIVCFFTINESPSSSAAWLRRPAELGSFSVHEEGVWSMQARLDSKWEGFFSNSTPKVMLTVQRMLFIFLFFIFFKTTFYSWAVRLRFASAECDARRLVACWQTKSFWTL